MVLQSWQPVTSRDDFAQHWAADSAQQDFLGFVSIFMSFSPGVGPSRPELALVAWFRGA